MSKKEKIIQKPVKEKDEPYLGLTKKEYDDYQMIVSLDNT